MTRHFVLGVQSGWSNKNQEDDRECTSKLQPQPEFELPIKNYQEFYRFLNTVTLWADAYMWWAVALLFFKSHS